MVLNRFNIAVLIQIILIALVGMLITIAIGREFMRMTTAGLILLWVGQILFLNFYMNRIHRDVRKFMDALRSQDTTQLFNVRNRGRYFGKLYASFNEITRNFRLVRIEKEVENQFFRETIKQSASGILALAGDKEIILINNTALDIFGVDSLKTLSELSLIQPDLADILASEDILDHQVKILVKGKLIQLAVKATEMNLDGTGVRIFSLLDISREMARNEVEAWQKLIRVLNHEITNSVVPLHILSTSLFDLFQDGERQLSASEIDDELIDRTILGLKTIIKRSGGLTDFLNTYKSFTDMGEPDYTSIRVSDMFSHVATLMEDELAASGIHLLSDVNPPELKFPADEKLIEHTIINLVKNSIFALEGSKKPEIRLRAVQLKDQVFIEVSDNGHGISEEIRDSIFTPFFTTRKEGSGIGLSLARQVMQMHNGAIDLDSQKGVYTSFTLSFQL